MERLCVICHRNAGMFRCIQCHKNVCDECAFKTEHGAFCGRECAATYRDFQRAQARASRPRSSALKQLLVLVIILALAAVVAYKLKPEWFANLPWQTQPAQQPAP